MSFSYIAGCLSTALGIGIGAAGGHKKEWTQERKDLLTKATFYHFMSNAGMIIGSYNNPFNYSTILFLIGVACFSGSLYHKTFTNNEDFKRLPPYGGMAMIFGWILLAFKK
ncbi:hypothetical protein ABPG74_005304 [Tetrahymena malaccensis]